MAGLPNRPLVRDSDPSTPLLKTCLNVLKNDIKHLLRQKQTGFFCKHKKAALSMIKRFHVFLMH